MAAQDLELLKYPVGKFRRPEKIEHSQLTQWINTINEFPQALSEAVKPLAKEQLEWQYRPNGWTIRQVVHHCADSHMNSQMRFKLALTEDKPTIKPYVEARWAELSDSSSDISWSLDLLSGLHKKWVFLLKNLSDEELKKTYYHPEHKRFVALDETIAHYSWHCTHHLNHVRQAIESEGKF